MELAAVVFALKIWWHYLYGEECQVYIDYKRVNRLFTQKNLKMRHWRWLETISDFQCEIKFHQGRASLVTDALSRKSKAEEKWETLVEDSLLEDMRLLLVKDRSPEEILATLQQLRINGFEALWEQ